ncbi:FAD-binding oxidoreductase [Rhodococcus gannanensis]|uniref:FAD-binding oxidoreductase n=1 Tax=Rhodococcus gannanensis TaxID=1960308 RepID=A0ABW4P472_9NOCA
MSITTQPPSPSTDQLRASVAGPVLAPGDADFDAELTGFNVASTPDATIVVGATCADDVAAAIRYARTHALRVGVRATGHGAVIEGPGTLIVTTARMNDVVVDPVARTARVGAGARWRDVAAATAPHGLTGLVGSSSGVGVVGYTLGGGLSPLGREFGFAADRVHSIELATADGSVRAVDPTSDPDLFWALLGGRDGFGVVTAIEIGLVELATLYGGGIFFSGDSASDVLHAWRSWAPMLPEEAGTSVAITRLPPDPNLPPPLQGQTVVHLRFTHTGDPDRAESLLAPIRNAGPVLLDTIGVMPVAALDAVHMDPPGPLPAADRGTTLSALPAEAVDALLSVAGPAVDSPLAIVEIRLLGGALRHPQGPANAVTGRDAGFAVTGIGVCAGPLGDRVDSHLRAVTAAVAQWTCGALLSFCGLPAAERTALWPADSRARLLEVRHRYDPAGTFSPTGADDLD